MTPRNRELTPPYASQLERFGERVERQVTRWLEAVALIDLVGTLAEAARRTQMSRRELDEARWVVETGGVSALVVRAQRSVRRSTPYRQAVARQVAELKMRQPGWGRKKIARHLTRLGLPVSSSAVRRALGRASESASEPAVALGGGAR